MSMGPLELYEIGEAVSEAHPVKRGQHRVVLAESGEPMEHDYANEWLGRRAVAALERKGWSLVRSEGERDG